VTPFKYLESRDLGDALAALARRGDEAKVIAGGTGLINLMKQNLVQPGYLIGIRKLVGLRGIRDGNGLRIGALCTQREIETSALVKRHAPLLAETCRQVATIRIRNMATLGGALAHADPSLDTPPALIALDARVKLLSARGERELDVADLFVGYYETVMRPDELLTEIVIPPQPDSCRAAFLKFMPATHDDYATVSVAVRVKLGDGKLTGARVALGSVGLIPVRATAVEAALAGHSPTAAVLADAAALVADTIDPVSDFRGSATYKRDMAIIHVRKALTQAIERIGADG
jgi:carbon-monoxide dehydrogenase medium subunit